MTMFTLLGASTGEWHDHILGEITYMLSQITVWMCLFVSSIYELIFASALFVCLFAIRAKLKLIYRGKQTNTSVLQSVLQISYCLLYWGK